MPSKRMILVALLALNGLMQVVGGTMMLLAPQQALTGIFKMAPSGDVLRLVAVVGGSTLAWLLLSGLNLTWVFRGRRPGFTLAIVQGLMLVVVGLIMTATGTTAGLIDAGKGILIT